MFIEFIVVVFDILRPKQNGRHFPDDFSKRIFTGMTENFRISVQFSLKFAPNGPITNMPALVRIIA